MSYKPDIPVGAIVELRHDKDDWRVVSHYDDERPRFVRQYCIENQVTGQKKRVFLHEIFEKNTTTYDELQAFFRQQSIPQPETELMDQENVTDGLDWNDILESEFDMNLTEDITEPAPELAPQQSGSGRFKPVTRTDVETLASKTTEKTTKCQTKWAVKIFKDWLGSTERETNFENLDPSELDDLLSNFYASLQTVKGNEYSKSSLVGIRAGLNRHLTSPPFQKLMNIMKDRAFMKSNQVLTGIIKQMKRDGKDTSESKEPISHSDLKKLNESGLLSINNPQYLQNKVIFDIMTHFGRRGREGLRSLKKDSFKIVNDADGHKYIGMTFNESDKTHHGIDSREQNKAPRMYATDSETCPVKAYVKYISKLNPECEALFQKPLSKFELDSDVWYGKTPAGVNHLYNFMSRLSDQAGLSRKYTNHCIRATVASNLCEAGVSNQGIMSVTGHRNVQSLNSYIKTSDKERRTISGILAGNTEQAVALASPNTLALGNTSRSLTQPQRSIYPTPSQTQSFSHSQSNNTMNIFSGNISGGHITVNVYKQ